MSHSGAAVYIGLRLNRRDQWYIGIRWMTMPEMLAKHFGRCQDKRGFAIPPLVFHMYGRRLRLSSGCGDLTEIGIIFELIGVLVAAHGAKNGPMAILTAAQGPRFPV